MVLDGDDVNMVVYYIVTCLSLPIISFTKYLLIFKSPPAMYTYRNTFLIMMSAYLLAAASFGLVLQPVYTELGSKSCAKLLGLGNYLGETVLLVFGDTWALGNTNIATSIVTYFLYRYLALAYPHLLEQRSSVRFYLSGLAIYALCNAIVVALILESSAIVKCVPQGGFYHICVNSEELHRVDVIIVMIMVFVSIHTFSGGVFLVLSIRTLRRAKSKMSAKTYKLQRTMTCSLLVFAALLVAFNVVPGFAAGIAWLMNFGHVYETISVIGHLPFIELVLVCLFTIVFVTPYRIAVLEMISKLRTKMCWLRTSPTVTVTSTTTH